ncbi:MAG: DUF2141 domain-containing protein [Chlorobi bacterium]|nr:DUF2141 domain-containing protein [Chlorobiota bacterium]
MKWFFFHRCFAVLIASFFLSSCAVQRPPSGGPPDTEPPFIEETEPPSETLNFTGTEITLTFNEYVDRNSFTRALRISPFMQSGFELDWSGKSVTIRFTKPLKKNQTYVITVGTECKDRRAGNAMDGSYSLAFSTGDRIDAGTITGRVYAVNPQQVSVFAYKLGNIDPDTLNPGILLPDYLTQPNTEGAFRFHHLARGRYRLFAVRESGSKNYIRTQEEETGVLPYDVRALPDSLAEFVQFKLIKHDTAAPVLQSAENTRNRMLACKWNEPLRDTIIEPAWILVRDTTGERIPVLSSIIEPTDYRTIRVALARKLRPAMKYDVTILNVTDAAGNAVTRAGNTVRFTAVQAPADSLPPRVLASNPAHGSSDFPIPGILRIRFSDPLDTANLSFQLRDSTGTEIPVTREWPSLQDVVLRPASLLPAMQYTLCFDGTKARSLLSQAGFEDSSVCVSFTTHDPSDDGAVQGRIARDTSGSVPVYVQLIRADRKPVQAKAKADGKFFIDGVPAGTYRVDAFEDRNGNAKFDYGFPFPFQPSEPFAVGDSIRVRPRWTTKGVLVRFPRTSEH